MEKRRIQLLKLLIERKEEFQPIKQLADKLDCSPRTLRNDLSVLSEKLEKNGFQPIERKPGVGVRLNEKASKWKQLMRWSWDLEHSSPINEEKERRLFVLYRLLMSKTPLTMSSLAEQHYVSNPVIRNDLDSLQEVCEAYNLTIQSIQHAGTTIEGTETNKRALLSQTVKQLSEFSSRDKALLQFFDASEISVVTDALNKLQRKFSVQFAPEALEGIKLHALFTIKRLFLNQPIVLSEEKRNSIRGTSYYDWATELAWMIQDKLKINFPVNEVSYLALHFKSARVDSHNGKRTKNDMPYPEWVTALVHQLIDEVSDLLDVPLNEDSILLENLVLHLGTTASRLENDFVISNPLLKEIKKEYVYLFHFIQSVAESFYESHEIILPEEEIGYLTVHFQAAIERQKASLSQNIEVGIVCHYGVGVSAFIQARIENRFPEIERTVILAENEVDSYVRSHPLSLILSTIPLDTRKIPTLMISPLLHDKEMEKVNEMLKLAEEKHEDKSTQPFSLLDYSQPFLIHLQKDFKTPEEVLGFMCRELAKRGYVEEAYLETVLKREDRAATAIGKEIALPHGNPSLVNHSTISCLTLADPIKWGSESVSIVFLLALQKEELKKEGTKGFFTYLHQTMENAEQLQQLKEEKNVMTFLAEFSI